MIKKLIISIFLLFIAACTSVPACSKTESPKARFVFHDKNDLYGLLDENGNEIVPAEYLHIDKIQDGMIPAFTKEKVFIFLDETGKKIKDVSFYDINPLYSEGLLGVADAKSRKWGAVDKNLNYVIEPQFDSIGNFEDGITYVYQNGLDGIIDKTGKYIFEPQFDPIEGMKTYYHGTLVLSRNGKIRIGDIKNVKIFDAEYDKWYGIAGNKIVLGKGSSIYLNSKENKEIFLMKKPNGSLGFIDKENSLGNNRFFINYRKEGEKDLHSVVFDSSNGEKICDIIKKDWNDEIDENCNLKESPHYDYESKYEEVRYSMCSHEHSTSFKQNGKWGFLDENGNVVIPAEYDDVSEFDFGVAWARKGERRFIIDRNGRIVVEIKPEWKFVTELRYTRVDYECYEWRLSGYCLSDHDIREYWSGRRDLENTEDME